MTLPLRLLLAVALFGFGSGLWLKDAHAQSPGAEPAPATPSEEFPTSESGSDGPPEGFEVINVKGREVTALESEVPTSVTQFTAEDIEALGAQNISDVSKVTPNVEIRTAGATSAVFFIRGVGLADFSANAAGAVAIYQDDVPINAPAMQLGLLYDLADVQVLRGPVGTGSGRNASAGAIKVYSRKPSGQFGASLRSTYGNYNYLDFEGAVEAPLVEEVLATRLAFRYSQRDPYAYNRCGGMPALNDLSARLPGPPPPGKTEFGPSFCGEELLPLTNNPYSLAIPNSGNMYSSPLPGDLPSRVNDLGRWAARGQLLFQPPDLEMSWMLNGHGYHLEEFSTLGQAIGTTPLYSGTDRIGYTDPDIVAEFNQMRGCDSNGNNCALNKTEAWEQLGPILANGRPLDTQPHHGDYNRVGMTILDTWGGFLRGDMTFGNVDVTTITGYDAYNRFRDTDQDFTPDIVFEEIAEDSAWQISQELKAEVQLESEPIGFELGAFFLMQELSFDGRTPFPTIGSIPNSRRQYSEDLVSYGLFGRFAWDFLDNFTLEGGVRYNWEKKEIQFELEKTTGGISAEQTDASDSNIRQAPTGEINLMYTFPGQDVQLIWKYARGWKGGQFNAASSLNIASRAPISYAEPEEIDDFELKLAGKWWDERIIFNASMFYYKYSDYQVFIIQSQPSGPPELQIVNANEAQVYGTEASLMLMPLEGLVVEELEGLRLEARFGWLESEFLDFVNPVSVVVPTGNYAAYTTQVPVDYSGNRLINAPEFKLSLTAQWTFDLGRWGTITPRYDGAWSSDISFNQAEGRETVQYNLVDENLTGSSPVALPECAVGQCAFWLHNLRLTYQTPDGNIEIAGWVRNIEDTVYRTYGFDASSFDQLIINYVSEPRFYGLDFTVRW